MVMQAAKLSKAAPQTRYFIACAVGSGIGSGSVEQESQRLDFLEQLLKQSKEEAYLNEQKNAKVYLLLGICAGLAVVIVTF